MRVAYFLSAFPSTSETFVLNQIVGVLEKGSHVDIHAYDVSGYVEHPTVEAHDLLNHVHYRPAVPVNKILRLCKACLLMMGLFLKDTRHCIGIFSLFKDMHLNDWIELFFLAWPLRGGKQCDVTHAHFGSNGLMAVRLRQAGFLQGKIITSFHGFDANVVPNLLGKEYYKPLFEQGDGFIVSSLFIRKRLLTLGCDSKKIQRIPVGVNVDAWSFKPRKAGVRSQPVLISVGRLVEVKGFMYAIAALPYVKAVFPEIQYKLVGDGPLRESLQKQVMDLGLQDCVQFCGAKSQGELVEMYQKADVFVMPSVKGSDGAEEGQGMVLLEAQAAGLPVVATNSGGIAESVADRGTLVAEKDAQTLAEAIITRLSELQESGYDGSRGRDFVKEHFDIARLNQQLLQLYEQLC